MNKRLLAITGMSLILANCGASTSQQVNNDVTSAASSEVIATGTICDYSSLLAGMFATGEGKDKNGFYTLDSYQKIGDLQPVLTEITKELQLPSAVLPQDIRFGLGGAKNSNADGSNVTVSQVSVQPEITYHSKFDTPSISAGSIFMDLSSEKKCKDAPRIVLQSHPYEIGVIQKLVRQGDQLSLGQ